VARVVAAAEFIGNPCVLQCDYWMGTELYCVFFYAGLGSDTNSFFYKSFLGITSGPFDIGGIRWPILIAMTVIWFLNWFIVYSGVQSGIERANKIMMPLLFLMMLVLMIRGVTLPGAAVAWSSICIQIFRRF